MDEATLTRLLDDVRAGAVSPDHAAAELLAAFAGSRT